MPVCTGHESFLSDFIEGDSTMLTLKPLSCRSFGGAVAPATRAAPGAIAQRGRAGGEPAAGEQEEFVLRTYEVGDLVVNVPTTHPGRATSPQRQEAWAAVGLAAVAVGLAAAKEEGGGFSVPDGDTPTGS